MKALDRRIRTTCISKLEKFDEDLGEWVIEEQCAIQIIIIGQLFRDKRDNIIKFHLNEGMRTLQQYWKDNWVKLL